MVSYLRFGFIIFLLTVSYVLCDAQTTTVNSKVSTHLATMAARCSNGAATDAKSTRSVNALVSLTTPCDASAFFDRHGCRYIDRVGRIYIVDIPLERVMVLAQNDTIERIEAERMPRLAMDVTPQQVNATGIYTGDNLPQAYTGADVVAGVFDSYYDFTHPAFLDANGDLRVQYYYDFHWENADGTLGHALETGSSDLQAGTGIKNGIAGGGIIDMDLVTPNNQLVRFDFLGIQLTGGGIEGTIMFNTDSISQVGSATFTTTVSMGQVQLTVEVSPYQDPRGTVYHIQGTLPHTTYLVLCGATVLLTGNGPAWLYSDIGFNSFTNITSVPQYSFAQPGHSVSWPAGTQYQCRIQ